MKIKANNKEIKVAENCKLKDLLQREFKMDSPRGIAVSVNFNIIASTLWEGFELQPNDSVLIIHATQGG